MEADQNFLLKNLIVNSLQNYLREIDNPSKENKIRWPLELIQNAKDSLYLTPSEQKQVSITLEIKGNLDNVAEVIFKHDGPPFTKESYYGLMYKFSVGKKNKNKTTGKFGTGFITTHVLSKTVFISGDIIKEDNNITGFTATMYREGKTDEEILSDVDKMNESFKEQSNRLNRTTFRYEIKTMESKQYAKLGVSNLKKHISYILINCPEIKCITLIENGKEIVYSASKSDENSMIYIVTTSDHTKEEKRFFLKFEKKPVDITIEIDDKYSIIPKDERIECIYVIFPLIGTGSHILPFSINSPIFEPSTERNNLSLLGKSDEAEANKNILLNSIELYKTLIDELINKKCDNIHHLARGLKLDKRPYESFDLAWYKENFLQPMRDILSKKVIVKSCSNVQILLSDAFFPSEIKDDSIEKFLKLSVIKKYYQSMIEYQDFKNWKDYIWSTPKMVSINDLIEKVQKDKSLFDEPQLKTFNEVLYFIWEYDKNLLHKQALIPNMKNELKCFSVFIKECKKVSDEYIQIIEEFNIPWKSTHANNMINSIQFDEDDETDAVKIITNEFQKLVETNKNEDLQKLSYCLLKYVIKNDEKREKIFQIASQIDDFTYQNKDIIYVSKVNPIIWKHADDFIMKKIIEYIQKFDNDSIKNKLDYIKEFIIVFKLHYKFDPDIINSTKIIPNAKNELKCLNDLFNQSTEFHNHFSSKINEIFGIDFDDRIINPEINQIIQSEKNEKITDFLTIIDENINGDKFNKFLPIAELVLSVIPSKNQQQKEIFNIYKLFKPSINEIIINDDSFNLKYYDKANIIILSKLCQLVEESGSLQTFQKNYSLNEEEAFNSLNLIYSKFEESTSNHAIIPNKNGKFLMKKELRIDPNIDQKVLDLFTKLDQNSETSKEQQFISLHKIIHPQVKINGIENFDIDNFYKSLNIKIGDAISNPSIGSEIKQIINDYIDIDFINAKNGSMSYDQKARMRIHHNSHITFIQNRVRELLNPKPSDFQRWPFELIQNATDCIQDSSERINNKKMNGHIVFIFNDNEVIFKHYGAPFTYRNLNSLLYQFGGEKEGKSKIGRFRTGFISTMILTRKVIVTGDIINDDGNIKGFTVTIDRSGKTTDELNNNIEKMEESLNTELEKTGKTKFVFKLPENKDENKNCYRAYEEGLKSLDKYIAPSLVFNPKIKSITVRTKTTYHVYTLEEEDNIDEEEEDEQMNCIKQIKKENMIDNKFMHRQFIYHNSQKIYNDKPVKIECLLEIGSKEKNIISNEEFLFLQFPLFGKKEFKSPIIINSPNFEPETERNGIIINDCQLKEENNDVSEEKNDEIDDDTLTSINKFIISESTKLYRSIIKSARNLGCVDLHNICYGLKNGSTNLFYQENFIEVLKSRILRSNVFEYSPGIYKNCKNIIIPYIEYDDFSSKDEDIGDEIKDELFKNYYDLVSQLKYESKTKEKISLMNCTVSHNWSKVLWPDFKHKFDIKQFLDYISEYENVDALPFKSKKESYMKKELFFSELIQFVLKMKKIDDSLAFGKHNVFLNKNKKLVSLSEIAEFVWNNETKNIIFDMMDIVQYNYKDKLLSDGLNHIYDKLKFDEFCIENAIHIIEDRINEENSISFMKYIIQDNDKRHLMYKYTKKLLDNSIEKVEISMNIFESTNPEYCIDNIINSMFRKADEFIINKLISKIQDINVKYNIDFLHDFVKLCKENIPSTKLENYKIVPNKNFKLCNYRELSKDCLENENLKNILKQTLKLDLNDELSHEKFNDLVDNKMNLNDASDIILDSINKQGEDFYKEDKCDLFKIIMKHSIDDDDDKNILLRIFNFFYRNKETSFKSENKQYFSFNLTKKNIELILNDISKCISSFDNIKQFAYYFKNSSSIYEIFNFDISDKKDCETDLDQIFNSLSDVYYLLLKYELLKADEQKIFPNDYDGDLRLLKDISIIYDFHTESKILFTLLEYLIIFSTNSNENQKDPNEIQKTILHRKIPFKKDFEKLLKNNIIGLTWFVNEINEKFPMPVGNEKHYSKVNDDFFVFIDSNNQLKAVFADLISQIKKDISPEIIKNLSTISTFIGDFNCLKFMKEYQQIKEKKKQEIKTKQPDPELKPENHEQPIISQPKPLQPLKKTRNITKPKVGQLTQQNMQTTPNSRPHTPLGRPSTPMVKISTSSSDIKLNPLEPLESTESNSLDINKYRKQAILYEKLKNNPNYSNVNWPIKSEAKTNASFTYNKNIYYLNLSYEKSNDYDISALYHGEITYFKVHGYFLHFLREENQKKDGKNIVSSFIDDENEDVLFLNNLD